MGFQGRVFFGPVLGTFWASTGNMGFEVSGYRSFGFFSGYRSFGFFGHLGFRVSGQDLLGSQWRVSGQDLLGSQWRV